MTEFEHWEGFARYVAYLAAEVAKGPAKLTVSDAWALVEMALEEANAMELTP